LRQTLALDELHAEILLALVLADFVDGHDVRMVELAGGLGLVMKADDLGLAGQFARADELERDQPVQAALPCAIDHAHAAPRDFFQQFVIADVPDFLADGRGRGDRHRFREGFCFGDGRRRGQDALEEALAAKPLGHARIEGRAALRALGLVWHDFGRYAIRLGVQRKRSSPPDRLP